MTTITTTLYHFNINNWTSKVMCASVSALKMAATNYARSQTHFVDESLRRPQTIQSFATRGLFHLSTPTKKNGVLKIRSLDKATIKMKLRSLERKIDSKLDFGQFFFAEKPLKLQITSFCEKQNGFFRSS